MLLIKLASTFALMAATPAIAGGAINPGMSRAQCISANTDKVREEFKNADAVICYHGQYQVYNKEGNYGLVRQVRCGDNGIHVDCFWMNRPAIFNANDDGGSDNISVSWNPNKCTWSSFWRSVNCQSTA